MSENDQTINNILTIKNYLVSCSVLFAIVLAYTIYRDIKVDKQNPHDLRNRVVGARLIKDGRSPYFYKWKKEDGVRYYDPKSFDRLKVSNITASPFFHHLMYPLAELPERQISKWWLFIEYCMFLICVFLACKIAKNDLQKLLVIILAAAFLFTEGWKIHVFDGQNYLCIPFLAFLFYYFISIGQKPWSALIAGCCSMAMVLIHVNAIFYFIPFLFCIKKYSKVFIVIFITPVVLMCLFIFFNKQERLLWVDYKEHVSEQLKIHQGLSVDLKIIEPNPNFGSWEGINENELEQYRTSHPIPVFSENGSVFSIIKILFHKNVPLKWLTITSLIIIAFLVFLFSFFYKRGTDISLPAIALMGFCFYMITEFFSPIYRWQYYSVQWLFPLLLAAATYKKIHKWMFLLLCAGLALNILNADSVKMEHTIGEYCMLFAIIILSLGDLRQSQLKSNNSIAAYDRPAI